MEEGTFCLSLVYNSDFSYTGNLFKLSFTILISLVDLLFLGRPLPLFSGEHVFAGEVTELLQIFVKKPFFSPKILKKQPLQIGILVPSFGIA